MAEKKITIRELIETGKRNGKLTTKEINEAIEETGFDVEQIDKLYETLERNSVEIVDEPDPEADAFTLTEASVDMFESALSAEGVAIDDPVQGLPERDRPCASADPRRGDQAGPGHSGRQQGRGNQEREIRPGAGGGAEQETLHPGTATKP